MLTRIPILLVGFRFVTGCALPLLAVLAVLAFPRWILVTLFLLGVFSDVLDGIVARRLGVDHLPLRRLDSRCDIVFALCSILASALATPSSLTPWLPWAWGYLALFLLRNAVDYARYRASPSYHMWSGRAWSLVVFLYLFTAFLGMPVTWFQPLAFALYAINALEGMAASFILPSPGKDIPSIWHVLRRKDAASFRQEP